MNTVTAICPHCNQECSLSEFRPTKLHPEGTDPRCNACAKRGVLRIPPPPLLSRVPHENWLIRELRNRRYYADRGVMFSKPLVDIIVRGCVWIEAKYSKLRFEGGHDQYSFVMSKAQRNASLLAHIVVLICHSPSEEISYHLFRADDPAFYMDPRSGELRHLKSGVRYQPGRQQAKRQWTNRIVMTDRMMETARNNWTLIDDVEREISEDLGRGIDPHEHLRRQK